MDKYNWRFPKLDDGPEHVHDEEELLEKFPDGIVEANVEVTLQERFAKTPLMQKLKEKRLSLWNLTVLP